MEQSVSNDFLETSSVNKRNLDELVGLVEELVINKVRIEKMKSEITNNAHEKVIDQELRIISEIQAAIKKVRLVKIKTITGSLKDLVNECNKKLGMEVALDFEGQETEIENSLISYIHNLLLYVIQDVFENEFLETNNEKKEIKISAYSDGKNLTTTIESNGKGFDGEALCRRFQKEELELLSFTEEEAKAFFEEIGFNRNMEEMLKLRLDLIYLDGNMRFESKQDNFRRLTVVVPLSSSIMQGMLVTVGKQTYAIPLDSIETILKSEDMKVQKFQDREMVLYLDHVIQLLRVSELLEVESTGEAACILVVSGNNRKAGLLVDSLLDQTDMVIKPKHSIMSDVNVIKGTTTLGDGLVTLVLDIPAILKGV